MSVVFFIMVLCGSADGGLDVILFGTGSDKYIRFSTYNRAGFRYKLASPSFIVDKTASPG